MQTELNYDKTIRDCFNKFHTDNPKVYELFKKYSLQAIRKGRRRLASKMIIERIRWYTSVETTEEDYKINNNYTAYYARLFMRDLPQYTGFFNTRKVR